MHNTVFTRDHEMNAVKKKCVLLSDTLRRTFCQLFTRLLPSLPLLASSHLFSRQAVEPLCSGGPLLSLLSWHARDSGLAHAAGILPSAGEAGDAGGKEPGGGKKRKRFHQAEAQHCTSTLYYVTSPGWRTRPRPT